MKNLKTFKTEELREMTLISFIGKISGYYFNYPNVKNEVRCSDKNCVNKSTHYASYKRAVPIRISYHFIVKDEEKPKNNDSHKSSKMNINTANVPPEIILKNVEELDDEDVP